jgi:hypothetical protein
MTISFSFQPYGAQAPFFIQHSMLDVRCSMFISHYSEKKWHLWDEDSKFRYSDYLKKIFDNFK